VVHREPLDVEDAARVQLTVRGDVVFVNDPASELAMVIEDGEFSTLDKYTDDGVAVTPPDDEEPEPPDDPLPDPEVPDVPDAGPDPADSSAPPVVAPPAPGAPSAPTPTTEPTPPPLTAPGPVQTVSAVPG